MASLEPGSWIWVQDEIERYLPAQVILGFRRGNPATVRTEDGEDRLVTAAETTEAPDCNPEALNSAIDDLINISDLNEMSILHNLRIRYKEDLIYTNVSSILISVNPFKLLPLYTPAMIDLYRDGARGKPPHVFAVAHTAYNNMLTEASDQSVVISGESGAGKSEATKLILQFLTDLSGRASSTTSSSSNLEQQILAANPILEAFGNAKTLRNNNSSRFGKLITVNFDKNGAIIGGGIINYLLEKSRVVSQASGERNYHIFYQLLAGGDANQRLQQSLKLQDAELFQFTNQSGVTIIEGVSDGKDFEDVQNSMRILNFTKQEQENVFATVAGVLHFGNVRFKEEKRANLEDSASVANPEVIQHASKLWGVDPSVLTKSLLSRNIGGRANEVIMVSYNVAQAQDARDAMCKRVYSELFQLVVNRINEVLASSRLPRHRFIGVLDIFGFESFETNSFEQLCINYCNEKLQFHFNEHIFRLEQNLYDSEGIKISSTSFKDNQVTLDLLEAKITGVFSMCDEEISVPRGSDEGMLQKILTKHGDGKHPNLIRPKPTICKDVLKCFGVLHYAGAVYYNVTNFLEKNKDQLHPDIVGALKQSTSTMILQMFPDDGSEGKKGDRRSSTANKSTKTLASQFKAQLNDLMNTLNSTFPHFVRCMKPNDDKAGNLFTAGRMQDQLRYAGLVEVCRIRKQGFPVRREFEAFFKRYRCCVKSSTNVDELLTGMVEKALLKDGQWAKGKTKIFLKSHQSQELEFAREASLLTVARDLQRVARGFLMRLKFKNYKKLLTNVKLAVEKRDLDILGEALDMSFELPFGGGHLQIIIHAKVLQSRLKEEKRVFVLLENAIAAREINSLKSAVAAAHSMVPPYEPAILVACTDLIKRLEAEQETRNKLLAAIASRDRKALETLLKLAADMELDCNETRQAAALKARLDEEEQALENLKKAINDRILTPLTFFIDKCTEMGLESPLVTTARTLQARLQQESAALAAVATATSERNMESINDSLQRARALGLGDELPEMKQALAVKEALQLEQDICVALEVATEARNLALIEAAIAKAQSHNMVPEKFDALQSAYDMQAILKAEIAAMESLSKAMTTENIDELSAALAEVSRLGLSGPKVIEARAMAKALGAQNEARDKLGALASSENLEDIDSGLQEAVRLGLMHTPEAAAVIARKQRLEEETVLMRELQRLVNTATAANHQELSRLVATAMRIGISSKNVEILASAKLKAKSLGEEVKVTVQIQQALLVGDLEALKTAITFAHVLKMDTTFADKKKSELERKAHIAEDLGPALEYKDIAAIRKLLAQAEELNMIGDKVTQARMLVERTNLIEKTYKAFAAAAKSMSLPDLDEALRMAIELGLDTPEVVEAQTLRGRLEIFEGAKSQLLAAEQVVAVKAESGLVEEDLVPMSNAIIYAESVGLPADAPALQKARNVYSTYQRHIEVREQLNEAASSGDRTKLRTALNNAEDLDMRLDVIAKVRRLLKEKDAQAAYAAEMQETGALIQGYEESERARQARRDIIRHSRYDLKNFNGLRTPDDFAKGVILNKQSVKDKFLIWQSSVITKSLMDLPKEHSKVAVQIHKDLLGYMGDKHMPFPAMLAQDVLRKGFESPVLRDEIFLQIIKQLSSNPRPESVAKGWQMMCMCVSTFPPSKRFENFLLHYILDKREKGRGAVVDYSKYCFRTLEGMLASGESSGFVPSVEEILAYKERPPILATIELVDGQIITEDLPVTPDLNVGKVLEICSGWLDLKDPRANTMGLFVYDMGEIVDPQAGENQGNAPPYADLFRTPRPLRNDDCMGDIIVQKARQKRNFKFVMKKKIFLPQHNYYGNDPYYERLVYLQCEDEVIVQGNIPITNEVLGLRLASISMAVALGDSMPHSVQGLIDENLLDFFPPILRDTLPPEEWAARVLQQRLNCILADPEDIQKEFVHSIQQNPLYGMHWFYVYKGNNQPAMVALLPKELILGFNSEGMHVFDLDRVRLHSFAYADIYRWGGSSSQFSLIIWDPYIKESFELIVVTGQAADMAAIILDHIRAIMSQKDSGL